MSPITAPFTLFHVVLSLVGISTGFVVLAAMLRSRRVPAWTAVFLATTLATTVTGFMFPFNGFTPALGVGGVSLVVLAVAIPALYAFRLAGRWRAAYVATALVALYLNVFVLVVQMFLKIPSLRVLAPTQKESPFAIAQGLVLFAFVALGILALRRFHPAPIAKAASADEAHLA